MKTESLKLKSYEIPDGLSPKALASFQVIVGDIEKTHAYYKQQIAFIKQQYQIALRALRPDIVSSTALREMFDEAEMTLDPKVETSVEDDEAPAPAPNSKKKKKKRPAIPEHLPRQIVEHDVEEAQKTCSVDGSTLRPMGHDVKRSTRTPRRT